MIFKEETLQKNCVSWFNLQYPKLKGLLCSNLNNSKDARTGARNKALGVVAGRSDLVLYYDKTAYHIEVKIPKGRQNEKQKDWQQIIESQEFNYYIIYSFDEFKQLIESIIM